MMRLKNLVILAVCLMLLLVSLIFFNVGSTQLSKENVVNLQGEARIRQLLNELPSNSPSTLDPDEIFSYRKLLVKKTCEKYYRINPTNQRLTQLPTVNGSVNEESFIFVDRTSRLMFCRIPGVASSAFWKSFEIGNADNIVPASILSPKDFQEAIRHYTKVMFVRNVSR